MLGADSGKANDFQLPDGSMLAQPHSGAELYGAFADAWSVAPAASLLANSRLGGLATAAANAPTISRIALRTIAAGSMQFICANGANGQPIGQTVLQATAPGQVLSAAAGVDVLPDAGGFGATFHGTLAQLANELISGSRPRTSSMSPTSTAPVS